MPENIFEWMWFFFFTIGSLGGWGFASIFTVTVWQEVQKRKRYGLSRAIKSALEKE